MPLLRFSLIWLLLCDIVWYNVASYDVVQSDTAFLSIVLIGKILQFLCSIRKPIFLTSDLKRAKEMMNNGIRFFQFRLLSIKIKLKTQFSLISNIGKSYFFSRIRLFLRRNDLFSTSIIILHHLSLYDSYNLKISPIFHSQGTLRFHKSFKSKSNLLLRKNNLFPHPSSFHPFFRDVTKNRPDIL